MRNLGPKDGIFRCGGEMEENLHFALVFLNIHPLLPRVTQDIATIRYQRSIMSALKSSFNISMNSGNHIQSVGVGYVFHPQVIPL